MKKRIAVFLAALMLLSLCGCKSKAAKEADELILKIGEVTASSTDEVERAQSAYDALSDKEKEQVENYAVLEQAQKDLAEAKRVRAISEFEKFAKNNPYESPDNSMPYDADTELIAKYTDKAAELREMGVTEEECPALGYADLVAQIEDYVQYKDLARTILVVYPKVTEAIQYEADSYNAADRSISTYGELRYSGYSSASEAVQKAIDAIDAGIESIDGVVDTNGYGVQTVLDSVQVMREKYEALLDAYEDYYYYDDLSALKDILSNGRIGSMSEECVELQEDFLEKNTAFGELLTAVEEKHAELFG